MAENHNTTKKQQQMCIDLANCDLLNLCAFSILLNCQSEFDMIDDEMLDNIYCYEWCCILFRDLSASASYRSN